MQKIICKKLYDTEAAEIVKRLHSVALVIQTDMRRLFT